MNRAPGVQMAQRGGGNSSRGDNSGHRFHPYRSGNRDRGLLNHATVWDPTFQFGLDHQQNSVQCVVQDFGFKSEHQNYNGHHQQPPHGSQPFNRHLQFQRPFPGFDFSLDLMNQIDAPRPDVTTRSSGAIYLPKTTCVYCRERFRSNEHQEHCFKRHLPMEFHCGVCPPTSTNLSKHFSFLKDLLSHLENDHKIVDTKYMDPLDMSKNNLLKLPSDLRSLRCRICKNKYILAQDRLSLSSHIYHSHQIEVSHNAISYTCRVCDKEFASGKELSRHPCCTFDKVENDFTNPTTEEEDEFIPCLYCDKLVPPNCKASHKSKHSFQDFQCGLRDCVKTFAFYQHFLEHLGEFHEVDVDNLEFDHSNAKLASDHKMVYLPSDLRSLECPVCETQEGDQKKISKKYFLGQDRTSLVSHIKRSHPGFEVDKCSLKYSCRSCGTSDFESSNSFLNHPCCENVKISQIPTKLKDVVDIVWDENNIPDDDLRRLVCRICCRQLNGTKLSKMIDHLEITHKIDRRTKRKNLESCVGYGCGFCPDLQVTCRTPEAWDRHFVSDDFKVCHNMDDTQNSDPEDNTSQTNHNDIRKLMCLICDYESNHQPFETMSIHLKTCHSVQTEGIKNQIEFVFLGCSKCPNFKAKTVGQWKNHFYKGNIKCRLSYLNYQQMEDIEKERNFGSKIDLRKLRCNICHLELNGSRFFDMMRHLIECHKMPNHEKTNFESEINFGCNNCQNFRPNRLHQWDRHFSKTFFECQGTCDVTSSTNTRKTYWCDTCSETRENVEQHFGNQSHKDNLKKLSEIQILHCDACDIAVSTNANFQLHVSSENHKQKMDQNRLDMI